MWDKVPDVEGTQREKELKERAEFWGYMIEKGSSCYRLDNTAATARKLVHMLTNHDEPIAVEIQRQLVDEKLTLNETSAGKQLQSEIIKERKKWEQERRELKLQMEKAIKQRDREAQEALEGECNRLKRMINKAEENTSALRSTMEDLIDRRDRKVASLEKEMQRQQASHKEELKRIEDNRARFEKERVELEKKRKNMIVNAPRIWNLPNRYASHIDIGISQIATNLQNSTKKL
ncbi:FAD binding domain-containing protein [Rutstroemia sp. NJR-2017a BVV2]|nr:FAD binding domain-containing protein [Rutstroemia sp. NJR-2017a BVV2]